MKLTGEVFRTHGVEANFLVTDAIVTQHRISIDWQNDKVGAHLDAASQDGVHFQGHYGYPDKNPEFEFELTLFKAGDEHLLFGTWCEHDSGDEGVWVFRIKAVSAIQTAIPAPRPRRTAGQTARKSVSSPKTSDSPSQRGKPKVSMPDPSPSSVGQKRPTKSVTRIESPQDRGQPEPKKEVAREAKLPPPSSPASAQLDHLLEMTPDRFATADKSTISNELNSASLSAVFKLAHNAKAEAVRSEAAAVYAKRYTTVTAPQHSPKPKLRAAKSGDLSSRRRPRPKK